jgi:hypothetical protein
MAGLVEKFLQFRLSHPYLLAVICVFNGINQERPSKLVVGPKEIRRVESWLS